MHKYRILMKLCGHSEVFFVFDNPDRGGLDRTTSKDQSTVFTDKNTYRR